MNKIRTDQSPDNCPGHGCLGISPFTTLVEGKKLKVAPVPVSERSGDIPRNERFEESM